MSFSYFSSPNEEKYSQNKKARIDEAITYLIDKKNPVDILNDQNSYEAVFFIAQAIGFAPKELKEHLEQKKEFVELIINVLHQLIEMNQYLDFTKCKIAHQHPNKETDSNEKLVSIFAYLIYSLNLLFSSLEIRKCFYNARGLNSLLGFLKDKHFVQRNKEIKLKILLFQSDYNIIHLITLNLNCLIAESAMHKNIWNELKAVDILVGLIKIKETIMFDCVSIISRLADDKQIESLQVIILATNYFVENLVRCAHDFESNKFNRSLVQIKDEGETYEVEIHFIMDRNRVRRYLTGICKDLYSLSVNDKYRLYLYFDKNIKELIGRILYKCNYIESKNVLKLVAQLSFNARVGDDLSKNEKFVTFAKHVVYGQEEQKQKLKTVCEQIMWNIYISKLSIANEKEIEKEKERQEEQDVMISFHSANKEICSKIKEKLYADYGLKVWMNENETDSSSMMNNTMNKAIEKSFCIFVCVTEEYRQSLNCQAECQYAVKLNKPIIPLIMQEGYHDVQGWLGEIIANKKSVDFTKQEMFNENFKELLKELNNYFEYDDKTNTTDHMESLNRPENMNVEQVRVWLEKNSVNKLLIEKFKSNDGQMMKQLYETKCNVIEFYNQTFADLKGVDQASIDHFTRCLEKLYNK